MIHPDTLLGDVGERVLVHHIRSRIPAGEGVVVGVGDDAAAVATTGLTLVTSDAMVEGVHFRREWSPPRLLGRKALSVSLADIAAMGGVSRYAIISLTMPSTLPMSFLDGLYDGFLERAAQAGVSLVGGNLSEGPSIVMDIAILGQADHLIRRSGALVGDRVVVTGTLGAAAVGLQLLKDGARLDEEGALRTTGLWTQSSTSALLHCLTAHLDPAPPLAFARALAEQEIAHAAMDVSDGLSGDLWEMCHQSGVAAWLDPALLPIDPQASGLTRARGGQALSAALHGGEDYQLLLAVPSDRLEALRDVAVIWDVAVTMVGEFTDGPPEVYLRAGEALRTLTPAGHDHFRVTRSQTTPPEA